MVNEFGRRHSGRPKVVLLNAPKMARKAKVILGPSHLSKVLESLTKAPRPDMAKLKLLKMTYAARNDHFGAR